MSIASAIEERVLGLRFDNKQFEEGAQDSISTLDKLKKSLEFNESSEGLDALGSSFKNLPLGNISEALEAITGKFSIMGTIGDQIIRRLTDGFLNLGAQITGTVKDLSINQIAAGFEKYGEKTSAVQTIMAATAKDFTDTGEQMEYVNGQLEKLNWFTDETSFNFLDMVSNIGKFTSNNIALDKSVTAMEGIGTWAAISGANVGEASRAMYNLSQAMATGAVKLIDWKSIENANMATAGFKETVIETAASLGKLTEVEEGVYKTTEGNKVSVSDFNSALSDAWFTSEVLMKSLEKYGGFTDVLYELSDATGETATDLLEIVDKYKEGKFNISAFAEETGLSADYIKEKLEVLGSAEMDLGKRSFQAAQEAKTFEEALEATKDAVSTGWMNTFEIIFGNYQEAKVVWTNVANELYDVFAASAEARNELLSEWKDAGGRDALFEGIANSWKIIKDLVEPVKSAFNDIFPPMTAERLTAISEAFRDFTDKIANFVQPVIKMKEVMKDGLIPDSGVEEKIDNSKYQAFHRVLRDIKSTAKGVFNTFKLVGQAIGSVLKGFSPLVKGFGTFIAQVFKITSGFDGFIEGIHESANELGIFERITNKVSSVTQVLADHLTSFLGPLMDIFGSDQSGPVKFVSLLSEGVQQLVSLFFDLASSITGIDFSKFKGKAINAIQNLFSFISDKVDKLYSIIKEIPAKANALFESLTGKSIREAFDDLKVKASAAFETLKEKIAPLSELFAKAKEGISNFFKSFKKDDTEKLEKTSTIFEKIGTALSTAWKIIRTVAQKISEAFGKLVAAVKEAFDGMSFSGNSGIMDLVNGGLFAGLLLGLNKITSMLKGSAEDGILSKIKDFLGGFGDILEGVQKNLNAFANKTNSEAIRNIAVSLAILAGSIAVLALINPEKLNTSLSALTTMFIELFAAIKLLDQKKNKKSALGDIATSMIKISASVLILSLAMATIGKIDSDKINKSLLAIGGLMLEIAAFSKIMDKSKNKTVNVGKGLITFAIGIRVLVSSVKALAKLDYDSLKRGLIGIGVIMGALAAFTRLADLDDMGISSGLGMVLLAASLNVLAKAVKKFSQMNAKELETGLIGVGIILAELAAFSRVTGKSKHILSTAVALTIISASLLIFANVISKFGNMQWQQLALGLGAMAAVLLSVAIAVKVMDGSLAGAAAMIVVAAALAILCPVLMKLGSMSLGEIGSALLMIAGVFLTLGVAGMALAPMVPVILGLTAAIVLLGIGVAAIGGGLLLLSAGLSALATSFVVVSGSLLATCDILLLGLTKLIVGLSVALVEGLKALAVALIAASPVVFQAIAVIIIDILELLRSIVPPLIEVGMLIILSLLQGIANNIDKMVVAAALIIVGILDGLGSMMDLIIDAAFRLVTSFVNGVANAIRSNTDTIINAVGNLLSAIAEFVIAMLQDLLKDLPVVGDKINKGLGDARNRLSSYYSEEEGEKVGEEFITGTKEGVENASPELGSTMEDAGSDAKSMLSDSLSGVKDIGSGLMGDLTSGLMSGEGSLLDTTSLLGNDVVSGLDVSDLTGQAGESSIDSYISSLGVDASEYGLSLGSTAADGAEAAIPEWEAAGYASEEAYSNAIIKASSSHNVGEEVAAANAEGAAKNTSEWEAAGYASEEAYRKAISESSSSGLAGETLAKETAEAASSQSSLKMISDSGTGAADEYGSAIEDKAKSQVSKSGETLPKEAAKGAKSKASDMKAPAIAASDTYAGSLGKNLSTVRSKGSSLASSGVEGAKSKSREFGTVGYNGAIGFGDGLSNTAALEYIKRKAREMANGALIAAKNQLEEKSPSKALKRIGAYGAEGFAIGLTSMTKMVNDAAKDVSADAIAVMDNAVSVISKLMGSDIDVTPVITPVLDLSNIQNGMTSIDGMINTRRAITLAASTKVDKPDQNALSERIDSTIDKALRRLMSIVDDSNSKPITVNVPLTIDKRQIARATATVNREELDRIDYFNDRKAGIA